MRSKLDPRRIEEIAELAFRMNGYEVVRRPDGLLEHPGCSTEALDLMYAFMALLMDEVDPPIAKIPCTGIAASWCPNCGTCSCKLGSTGEVTRHSPTCALHGEKSNHGEIEERCP